MRGFHTIAKEMAADWAVDYKPMEDNLSPQEYARYGYERGFMAGHAMAAEPQSVRDVTQPKTELRPGDPIWWRAAMRTQYDWKKAYFQAHGTVMGYSGKGSQSALVVLQDGKIELLTLGDGEIIYEDPEQPHGIPTEPAGTPAT